MKHAESGGKNGSEFLIFILNSSTGADWPRHLLAPNATATASNKNPAVPLFIAIGSVIPCMQLLDTYCEIDPLMSAFGVFTVTQYA